MSKPSEAVVKAAKRVVPRAPYREETYNARIAQSALIIHAAADEKYKPLVDVARKVTDWLERIATQSDKQAADKRFPSLAAASAADAKNYRAIAKSIFEALQRVKGE